MSDDLELSKTRESGGYDILDIPLYLQLLYTKQLNQYYLYKTEPYDRLPHLLLMEYNVERLLSSKFPTRNRICLNRRIFINSSKRS